MGDAARRLEMPGAAESLREVLIRWAHEASVELNVQDLALLPQSADLLPGGSRIYISHLPKQTFEQTLEACAVVKAAGLDPVPHVPVRLLKSHAELLELVTEASLKGVNELLLISGDYPKAVGPFSNVAQVLRAVDLREHGIDRVSIGGHPEGNSKVALEEIRRAEIEKGLLVDAMGLKATYVTQFFFESAPFVSWARELRGAGVNAGIRAGLAGPAKIATLLRYAARCGVGPSITALGSRPSAFAKLLGEHGPEHLLTQLAGQVIRQPEVFQGIHMFCFGGYLRTCGWLRTLASGQFHLDKKGELLVQV